MTFYTGFHAKSLLNRSDSRDEEIRLADDVLRRCEEECHEEEEDVDDDLLDEEEAALQAQVLPVDVVGRGREAYLGKMTGTVKEENMTFQNKIKIQHCVNIFYKIFSPKSL